MSGNGRSSSGGSGGGGGNTPPRECQQIYKPIALMSPVPEVVATLKIGERLELERFDVKGKATLRVLFNGLVTGAILFYAAEILECMEKGFKYLAIVTQINGGDITLEVRMDDAQ